MLKALAFVLITVLLFTGCEHVERDKLPSTAVKEVNPIAEMTIEDKVSHGINTGTPADTWNRNPYSVFQPYSPWNPYQNDR